MADGFASARDPDVEQAFTSADLKQAQKLIDPLVKAHELLEPAVEAYAQHAAENFYSVYKAFLTSVFPAFEKFDFSDTANVEYHKDVTDMVHIVQAIVTYLTHLHLMEHSANAMTLMQPVSQLKIEQLADVELEEPTFKHVKQVRELHALLQNPANFKKQAAKNRINELVKQLVDNELAFVSRLKHHAIHSSPYVRLKCAFEQLTQTLGKNLRDKKVRAKSKLELETIVTFLILLARSEVEHYRSVHPQLQHQAAYTATHTELQHQAAFADAHADLQRQSTFADAPTKFHRHLHDPRHLHNPPIQVSAGGRGYHYGEGDSDSDGDSDVDFTATAGGARKKEVHDSEDSEGSSDDADSDAEYAAGGVRKGGGDSDDSDSDDGADSDDSDSGDGADSDAEYAAGGARKGGDGGGSDSDDGDDSDGSEITHDSYASRDSMLVPHVKLGGVMIPRHLLR